MQFTKVKNPQLPTLFPSSTGSTTTSLKTVGQNLTLTNKNKRISTETFLRRYHISVHSESTFTYKSNSGTWKILMESGLLPLTTRWFACLCWRCPVEILSTLMISSICMCMGRDTMIALWTLPFNGVSRITLRPRCLSISVIKSLLRSPD